MNFLSFRCSHAALCVGPRHSVSAPGALPPLSVSGRDALCVGPGRSRSRGPGARRRSPALCVSGLAALSLSRAPTLSVSGPGALCVRARCEGPALCRSLWQDLCRAPAFSPLSVLSPAALSLFVSGPNAFCVRPRCSLCRAPACRRAPGALCVGPGAFHVGRRPALSVSGPGALCVGTRHSLCRGRPSGFAGPQLRSACHPSSPARSLFPGENPKTYCLEENIKCTKTLGMM